MDLALARWQAEEMGQYSVSGMKHTVFHVVLHFILYIVCASFLQDYIAFELA